MPNENRIGYLRLWDFHQIHVIFKSIKYYTAEWNAFALKEISNYGLDALKNKCKYWFSSDLKYKRNIKKKCQTQKVICSKSNIKRRSYHVQRAHNERTIILWIPCIRVYNLYANFNQPFCFSLLSCGIKQNKKISSSSLVVFILARQWNELYIELKWMYDALAWNNNTDRRWMYC